MDPNNKKDQKNNQNRNRNMRGVVTLIIWALVLTVVFNYINAYSNNLTKRASSHEIPYSQLIDLIQEDQVAELKIENGVLYATPVDGYVYTEEACKMRQNISPLLAYDKPRSGRHIVRQQRKGADDMQKSNNLQEIFLTKARKQSIPLTIFLMNGFQLRGVVTGFDCFTVVLDTDGKQQIIYKHAISTIVPIHPVSLQEEPCLPSNE